MIRKERRHGALWYDLAGEVSEWLKVLLSKSSRVQALVGSNPTLSANDTQSFASGRWTRLGQSEVRSTDTESERYRGEVLERPNRRAWKARRVQALVGSNPTLSASY